MPRAGGIAASKREREADDHFRSAFAYRGLGNALDYRRVAASNDGRAGVGVESKVVTDCETRPQLAGINGEESG